MPEVIVRYDHDEGTDTEISIETQPGRRIRFAGIAEAAEHLGIEGPDLLHQLEATSGEVTMKIN